jgi:hypothetical protein
MNVLKFASLAALALIITGCSSTRVDNRTRSTTTTVGLNERNFKMVCPGASGTSYGFRLLGIIPFASPHYATARTKLYRSAGGDLTGKAIALANEMEDKSTVYLVLFSVPKFTLTADVIEFVDDVKPRETAAQ